jgi:hypothetical protein
MTSPANHDRLPGIWLPRRPKRACTMDVIPQKHSEQLPESTRKSCLTCMTAPAPCKSFHMHLDISPRSKSSGCHRMLSGCLASESQRPIPKISSVGQGAVLRPQGHSSGRPFSLRSAWIVVGFRLRRQIARTILKTVVRELVPCRSSTRMGCQPSTTCLPLA